MPNPVYVAYPNVADTSYVVDAPATFPRRDTALQAAEDCRDAWHKRGHVLSLYQIDADGTVTRLEARLHRVLEVANV